MIKEFLDYEQSLALKELGFDGECLAWFSDKNIRIAGTDGCVISKPLLNSSFLLDNEFVCAPLKQQALRFFREKYQKNTAIFSNGYQWTFDLRWVDEDSLYKYPTIQFPKREVGREWFDTYEDVEIGSLQKLIEIVKEQNYEK